MILKGFEWGKEVWTMKYRKLLGGGYNLLTEQ